MNQSNASADASADAAGPSRIQDFIFVRELSEVYLLLDHVSGRWDKNLLSAGAEDVEKTPADPLAGPRWIEQICEIGWPPSGSEVQRAKQAATLLRAKDRLNAAAKPANGVTIAFTLLVAGEDNPGSEPNPAAGAAGFGADDRRPPSRISLARFAYPGLVKTASRFKWQIRTIIGLLLVWLAFTCLLSWHVTMGHAILSRLDDMHGRRKALVQDIAVIEAKLSATPPGGPPARALDKSITLAMLAPPCERGAALTAVSLQRPEAFDRLRLCEQRKEVDLELAAMRIDLFDWLAWWQWCRSASQQGPGSLAAGDSHVVAGVAGTAATGALIAAEQWAAILAQVLAAAVLPLCYGVLGAGAAVVRDLWNKMRESLLAPRDLTLALGQLALGAVIGACIGLFITPSGPAQSGAGMLNGQVALTASALSFIAGFGVEGVFVMLENLIKRVFNVADPAAKPA